MTSADRALAAWQALNERQQQYLGVIYRADQDTEAAERGAWAAGGRSRPAAEWRWMPYGPVGNAGGATGPLQQLLAAKDLRDQGAGATFTTLEKAKLIITRSGPAVFADYHLDVQITAWGRQVARAGGVDPARALAPRRGMLSEGLWAMLVKVWVADDNGGHPVYYLSGAWERLTNRTPPFAEARNAESRFGYLLHLTEEGRQHYRDRWADYARSYAAIDAPHPDGAEVWPAQVDQGLAVLGERCAQLRGYITTAASGLEQLASLAEHVPAITLPPPTPAKEVPASARAGVIRRDRAAAACQRAIDRAAARYAAALEQAAGTYREALVAHQVEMEEPYRQACLHYVLAAAAVVQAVADGRDPIAALDDVDPASVTVWPWVPTPPVTGLVSVDSGLQSAYVRAGGKPARGRRKAVHSADLLREGAQLTGYAAVMAELVGGGQLGRLLLRKAP
ncbi:hypothetical protein AB0395_21935 [Streptosporangium sp. NPDC051023]|uniref:hypothetical protein n=1 Tax=Streptosporangium sp. NPDC051023 TaxID=3155410 RepID=UPI00344F23ED